MNKNIIRQFLENGKNLTLLNGKVPISKDWGNKKFSEEDILTHQGNIGWVLGENDLVMDVDPRNGGEESFNNLNYVIEPTVITPSGGYHIYFKIPDEHVGKKLKKTLSEYKGIDFLSKGAHCVIPSSVTEKGAYTWYDEFFGSFQQSDVCPDILAMLLKDEIVTNDDEAQFGNFLSNSHYDESQILEILYEIDPSTGYEQWIKVGMALHDWDKEKGLKVWEEWSRGGDNYEEGKTEYHWESFDNNGGITIGTLFHISKEAKYEREAQEIESFVRQIKQATEKELQTSLIPELKKKFFSGVN